MSMLEVHNLYVCLILLSNCKFIFFGSLTAGTDQMLIEVADL